MSTTMVKSILDKNRIQNEVYRVHKMLINDVIQEEELIKIETVLSKGKIDTEVELICSMDHNVPAASVDAIKVQNRIKRICELVEGEYIYGQGIGQYLITKNKSINGEIIVSNDPHITMVGASGAIGISITDNIADILINSSVTMPVKMDVIAVEFEGKLNASVNILDLLFFMKENVKISEENVVIEYVGEAVKNMSMSDRMKLTCYAPELGALSAIINTQNSETAYAKKIVINLSDVKHGIQSEYGFISNVPSEIPLEQGFVGGCMAGLEDFKLAAELLKGRKIAEKVKCIFAFPTNEMYLEAVEADIVKTLMESGAIILNSGCGACWGGCQGKIGSHGTMITIANRIQKDCDTQQIYLASAREVVESCIAGKVFV